jgi:uncharacterized protein
MRSHLMNALLYVPQRELTRTPADAGLPYEDLTVETEDGERLHGWWVPARTAKPLAHILFFHGNAGNISRRVPDVELLAPEGFDVLLFDYRGYGRSTGRPSEQGTYRDARAVLAAIRTRPGVRSDHVFYLGESLGAAVAIALAEQEPPTGLILRSPFINILEMARIRYPRIPRFLVPDAYPSLRRIAGLTCPLLVVHGDQDRLIPLSHGQAIFAAARGPKQMEVLVGAGHNDTLALAGPRQARLFSSWTRSVLARASGRGSAAEQGVYVLGDGQ